MPEGQFTGSRGKYVYTNDAGDKYILRLDSTLVMSNSGLTVYDPATDSDATPKPLRFTPRGVFWQATASGFEGRRKYLIAGAADAALYQTAAPATFNVDGVAGTTTGRKGEKLTYL